MQVVLLNKMRDQLQEIFSPPWDPANRCRGRFSPLAEFSSYEKVFSPVGICQKQRCQRAVIRPTDAQG